MCEFFSFIMCRNSGIHYHDMKQRRRMAKLGDNPDSHAMIARTFGLNEDDCIKIEYTPGEPGVIVDHCPEWAMTDRALDRRISDEYLAKVTHFATTFDFKAFFPLWPDNFAKLGTMKRVRSGLPKRLSPKVIRCLRALPHGVGDGDIRSVHDALGKLAWLVVKQVSNSCSHMPLSMDHLRAVQRLGWLDLIYKRGTKRRKRIDQVLQLIDAGINPVSIVRLGRSWHVALARRRKNYYKYIVSSAGVVERVRV